MEARGVALPVMPETRTAAAPLLAFLAFNASNQLAVRKRGPLFEPAFIGDDLAAVTRELADCFPTHTPPAESFGDDEGTARFFLMQVKGPPADPAVEFRSIENLESGGTSPAPSLQAALRGLEPHLIEIPYLHLGENDFIYKFRPEKERNPETYANDPVSGALYQSRLCAALKMLTRQLERSAADPVTVKHAAR